MRAITALRLGTAALVLGVLLQQLGTGPFVQAVTRVTPEALLAALLLTLASTTCCALRWVWVAQRLGPELSTGPALAAYYRSLFLNQTLPGGVLGDVHRAVRQGAVRSVVWERVLGQAGLLTLAAVVLLVLPSPVPRPWVLALTAGLVVAGALTLRWLPPALRACGVWRPLALSVAAAAGHLLLLLVALRTTLPDVGTATAVPLLVTVLVASSVPTNLAGWGPREGAAAALFAWAGLGAGAGVTVAATFGVLSLLAALPGGLLLLADLLPRPRVVGSR